MCSPVQAHVSNRTSAQVHGLLAQTHLCWGHLRGDNLVLALGVVHHFQVVMRPAQQLAPQRQCDLFELRRREPTFALEEVAQRLPNSISDILGS